MTKHAFENRLYKAALASAIDDMLRKHNMYGCCIDESSYSSKSDMVTFRCDGHKCRFIGLCGTPDMIDGTIEMIVLVDDDYKANLIFPLSYMRGATLAKIAVEVYDNLCGPDDEPAETFINERVANYFDTYAQMA